VNYDEGVAAGYARRYELHDYADSHRVVAAAIGARGARVLDVGCGQGTWTARLRADGYEAFGVDPSRPMLGRAHAAARGRVVRGIGERLPVADATFDAVLFMNSFHHLSDPEHACAEARRVLRRGGTFVSIGLDPHERADRWFLYDLFPDARSSDLRRYPARERRVRWLERAGFDAIDVWIAERLRSTESPRTVRAKGLLERGFTSQLTLLSEAAYRAGLERFEAMATEDERVLEVDLTLFATIATA
jgi:SAM-dependent methyltransferase